MRGADWVVRSSAIADDNPEVQAALAAGIPVYRRADFLGKFMEDKQGIAVAGTHGKTTTTAMIAFVLSELGLEPSFIVGGVLSNYGVNARAGQGQAFVVEADEYDRMFLGLKPQIEVITSLEHDHPDIYPTFEDMQTAFESFVSLLPLEGTLIACFDDPAAAALLAKARRVGRQVMAYSLKQEATITAPRWMQARNLQPNRLGGFDFDAATNVGSTKLVSLGLQVPGEHNVSNALAALSVCAVMGVSVKDAGEALGRFRGTGRRFEVKGERGGVIVIDDYAHHPTEIRATLAAARRRYPEKRIWAVWQPHTYSRTQALFDGFVSAFDDADETIVTEIYRSREPAQDYSSRAGRARHEQAVPAFRAHAGSDDGVPAAARATQRRGAGAFGRRCRPDQRQPACETGKRGATWVSPTEVHITRQSGMEASTRTRRAVRDRRPADRGFGCGRTGTSTGTVAAERRRSSRWTWRAWCAS